MLPGHSVLRYACLSLMALDQGSHFIRDAMHETELCNVLMLFLCCSAMS